VSREYFFGEELDESSSFFSGSVSMSNISSWTDSFSSLPPSCDDFFDSVVNFSPSEKKKKKTFEKKEKKKKKKK